MGTLTIKETLQSSVWGQSSRLEMIITGTSGWLGSDGIWGVKPLQPHGCLNKSCLEKNPVMLGHDVSLFSIRYYFKELKCTRA